MVNQFDIFAQVLKIVGVVAGAFWAYGKFMSHIREMEMKIQILQERQSEKEKEFEKLENKLDIIVEKINNVQLSLSHKQDRP